MMPLLALLCVPSILAGCAVMDQQSLMQISGANTGEPTDQFRGRATKFPRNRPQEFRGAQIRPRNPRVFVRPYLHPYSPVAPSY